ncbi:hypothetical protein EAE99_002165 [Botrytis elliptica]|nr:hypothetical protein EAE99_002165 [Botrytis elliptica]
MYGCPVLLAQQQPNDLCAKVTRPFFGTQLPRESHPSGLGILCPAPYPNIASPFAKHANFDLHLGIAVASRSDPYRCVAKESSHTREPGPDLAMSSNLDMVGRPRRKLLSCEGNFGAANIDFISANSKIRILKWRETWSRSHLKYWQSKPSVIQTEIPARNWNFRWGGEEEKERRKYWQPRMWQ